MLRHKLLLSLSVFLSSIFVISALSPNVLAAGDASFAISPSSDSYTIGQQVTVQVTETSQNSDDANAAQVDLTYPTSLLRYDSASNNGPFTICGQSPTVSGNTFEMACADSSTVSGTQNVVAISFSAISTGSASLNLTSGSDIDNPSGGSVFNGNYASASFSLTSAPAATTTSSGASSSSSSGASRSSGTSSSSSSKSAGTTGSTNNTTNNTSSKSKLTTVGSTTSNKKPSNLTTTITLVNQDDQILTNAKIKIGSETGTTNSEGEATIKGLYSGNFKAIVQIPGSKAATYPISLTAGKQNLFKIQLDNNKTPLLLITAVTLIALVILAILFNRKRLLTLFKHEQQTAKKLTKDRLNVIKHTGSVAINALRKPLDPKPNRQWSPNTVGLASYTGANNSSGTQSSPPSGPVVRL